MKLKKMGNIESVDGQSEMKHHIMPLKVPMPDPTELEEKFAIVLVSSPPSSETLFVLKSWFEFRICQIKPSNVA